MKDWLRLGLVAGLALAVLGCSPKANSTAEPGAPAKLKVAIVYDKGGLGDKSFNDSAARGIEKAKAELGVEAVQIESKEVKDYESNLREMADLGNDLVIAVGINMQKALETVAKEFPNTKFAIVDAPVDLPNVRSLLFKEEEGSFLVGYLAGLMTKTNKIGFIGGMNIPLIKKFEYGYLAGAKLANPAVELVTPLYTGDWDNIDTAKSSAGVIYSKGADIIYHAAGRAGLGVIRAAKDQGKFAIGVDSDQDSVEPGSVLTSMIKRVDVSVFQTISDLKNGNFTAGSTVYDLKSDGVGYSDLTHTRDLIGADKIARLEEVKRHIIDGHVMVPSSKEDWDKIQAAEPQGG